MDIRRWDVSNVSSGRRGQLCQVNGVELSKLWRGSLQRGVRSAAADLFWAAGEMPDEPAMHRLLHDLLWTLQFFSFFFFGCTGLSYSMWDLFPWPGIEPRPPALRAWSLSHWITREIQCSSLILWFGATDGFLMVNHLVKVDFISFQIYFLFLKMHKEMCSL